MAELHISDAIRYIGVDDLDIDLFESQYPVANGVSYNAYLILDEKTAIMDTVDGRKTAQWLENLERELNGRTPDYLVLHHLEPDHAGGVGLLLEKYPQMQLVGSAKTFTMLPKYFTGDIPGRTLTVKEGESLSLGSHTLTFYMAPMVHWPEVMVSYERAEKVLFSADAFGKFGALSRQEDWTDEARRYYFNIVGKYGAPVQTLLKKAAGLEIGAIAPLHGPVLRGDLGPYLAKYDCWGRYQPEEEGVLVAYASIHGNTAQAAQFLAEELRAKGCPKVVCTDLCREDQSRAVANAFRFPRLACLSATYDGGLFPAMEHFLCHLRDKTYRGRAVALVENGSWAPAADKLMRAAFQGMKEIDLCGQIPTIQGAVKAEDRANLSALADELLHKA